MTCLVVNCNHWIGFHITNELLANNYQIDGMENKKENNHLSMFFGRNSSFSFVHSDVKMYYDFIVSIGEIPALRKVQAGRIITIGGDAGHLNHIAESLCIQPPILFGEWMPMNEEGFYHQQEWVTFDSDVLKKRAVYIKDFAKGLTQWLKTTHMSEELIVKSIKQKEKEGIKSERTVYIRDTQPMDKNVKIVRDHYKKHKAMYADFGNDQMT